MSNRGDTPRQGSQTPATPATVVTPATVPRLRTPAKPATPSSASKTEKQEWVDTYKRQQREVNVLMKELLAVAGRFDIDLREEIRPDDSARLIMELNKIKASVDIARSVITGPRNYADFTGKLERALLSTEDELQSFKDKQREIYDEWALEERTLWREAQQMDRRLVTWDADQHEWYEQYQQEFGKKKELVKHWREQKENAQKEQKAQQEQAELHRQQADAEALLADKRTEMTAEERAAMRAKIAEWHAERQRQQAERKAAEEAAKRAEEQRKQQQEQARRERMRDKLSAYREQKAAAAEQQEEAMTARRPSTPSRPTTAQLRQLADRDIQRAAERRARAEEERLQQAQQAAALERIAEAVKPVVNRDATRLVQPTVAAAARQAAVETALMQMALGQTPTQSPLIVTRTQQRATPSWRRGL